MEMVYKGGSMSTRKEKKLNIVLGACAGVLVLAGGLCVLLLGGEDKGAQLVQATPETTMTPVPTATEIPQANIVVSTPEVDLVAEKHRQEMEAIAIRNIMLPGTTIYGVNVGGMSRDEAKAAVEERLVRDPLIVNLQLSDGTNLYPASGEGIDTLLASTKVAQEEEEDDDAVDPAMKAAEAAADTEPEPETTDPTDTESIGIRLNIDVDKAVTEAFSLMRDMNVGQHHHAGLGIQQARDADTRGRKLLQVEPGLPGCQFARTGNVPHQVLIPGVALGGHTDLVQDGIILIHHPGFDKRSSHIHA